MSAAAGFSGRVVSKGEPDYDEHCYQYATTSRGFHVMSPAFILYPSGDEDVLKAIEWASERNVAIALRTGGHQYSGSSSTWGDNIQLDLSQTYKEFEWQADSGLLRIGISWPLLELNARLGQEHLFVPHGQCSHVRIGGHVQTGGYGMLSRSLGLFADAVEVLEVITATAGKQVLRRDGPDPQLFKALLGGSPGNFAVITHVSLRPFKDADFAARGLRSIYMYSHETMLKLTSVLADMAGDDELDPHFDYCVSMVSSCEQSLKSMFPNLDAEMCRTHPELYGHDGGAHEWPAMIAVFAQWAAPRDSGAVFDPALFQRIKAVGPAFSCSFDETEEQPVSQLMRSWIFLNVREFELPFEKRTNVTNSVSLSADGWPQWVCEQIDWVQTNPQSGCKLAIQFQVFGGKASRFRTNAAKHTSFSWRDTTVTAVLDCFYDPSVPLSRKAAKAWQRRHEEQVKPGGKFCQQDRRVHWGSFGNVHMDQVWQCYYESKEKYRNLCEVKARVDPRGVFSPNGFTVGAGQPPQEPSKAPVDWTDKVMLAKYLERYQ